MQSRTPSVANLILRTISLDYHEAVMAPAGDQAEKSFRDAVDSRDFYYVIEGAVADGIPGAMTVHGKTSKEIVEDTYNKAKGVIAIGTCATYGNIQAAFPNPTGALGVTDYLKKVGKFNPAKPVINVSRCPGNAEDMLSTLSFILFYNKLPELDSIGRPKFLYGQLIHDNCERRGHFEAGEFVEVFGDEGSRNRFCFYKVGCKGPQTFAPCPTARWNGHLSWCVHNGPCIGCAEPRFWDELSPFYQRTSSVTLPGIGGVSTRDIGVAIGVVTAVGIGAHFLGQAASGRLGRGGPPEPEKKTRSSKGGRS